MENKEIVAPTSPCIKPLNLTDVKHNRSVCIIGFAPSWNQAPYGNEGVDFWGLNELYIYLKQYKINQKFSAWFEIHNIKNSPSKQSPKHQEFLKNCKIPLITQQHWDDYPTSLAYPRDEVKEMVNGHFIIDETHAGFSDYSNQISWMIALAIYLGYKEISVYGVDMAQTSEYAFQRASCQFFIGLAAGKGIKLKIPNTSELLKAGADYGFQTDNKNRFNAKKRIEGHNNALGQVRMRQAEIKYYHDKLDKEGLKKKIVLEAQIKELETEIIRLTAGNESNKSVLEFLSTMPQSSHEVFAKRDEVLNKTKQLIELNNKDIETLNKNISGLKKKMDNVEKDVSINHTLLDEEYEANKNGSHELKGHIKAHEHNLNNNLV